MYDQYSENYRVNSVIVMHTYCTREFCWHNQRNSQLCLLGVPKAVYHLTKRFRDIQTRSKSRLLEV